MRAELARHLRGTYPAAMRKRSIQALGNKNWRTCAPYVSLTMPISLAGTGMLAKLSFTPSTAAEASAGSGTGGGGAAANLATDGARGTACGAATRQRGWRAVSRARKLVGEGRTRKPAGPTSAGGGETGLLRLATRWTHAHAPGFSRRSAGKARTTGAYIEKSERAVEVSHVGGWSQAEMLRARRARSS